MSAKPTDGTKAKAVPTAPTAMQQWFPIGAWLPKYNWGKFLGC